MFSYANLYFVLQRARGGVNRKMIAEASALLSSSGDVLAAAARERLIATHGEAAEAADWLGRQPLVDRRDLVQAAQIVPPKSIKVEWRKTSGSSGVPFRFPKDLEMSARMDAVMWALYDWHGIAPGQRKARFWGTPLDVKAATKQRVTDWVQNRRRLSAFDVDAAGSVEFFARMRRFRPEWAYGYPTLVHEFVKHCRNAGLDGRELRIPVIICTGELLHDSVRAEIADFFGCRVVNEYGCTESGIVAFECEAGTLHLTPVAVWPEILRPDGSPCVPGEAGEVVITDLYGRVAPLLRYRLHDVAAPAEPTACACGRALPALAVQRGRVDSFIVTPSRGRVYDAVLAYTVPPQVLRFRVFQLTLNRLRAEVVAGPGFEHDRTPLTCKQLWEDALGPGMTVDVQVVDDIPLTAGGKMRYFVPLPELVATTPIANKPQYR